MQHLTEQQAEAAADQLFKATDLNPLSYLDALDPDQRQDLMALAWYGSRDEFDYAWHRSHLLAGIEVEVSPENIREGLRKLRAERGVG